MIPISFPGRIYRKANLSVLLSKSLPVNHKLNWSWLTGSTTGSTTGWSDINDSFRFDELYFWWSKNSVNEIKERRHKMLWLAIISSENSGEQKTCSLVPEDFQFRWMKTKRIYVAFPFSIPPFSEHLKSNSMSLPKPVV